MKSNIILSTYNAKDFDGLADVEEIVVKMTKMKRDTRAVALLILKQIFNLLACPSDTKRKEFTVLNIYTSFLVSFAMLQYCVRMY